MEPELPDSTGAGKKVFRPTEVVPASLRVQGASRPLSGSLHLRNASGHDHNALFDQKPEVGCHCNLKHF